MCQGAENLVRLAVCLDFNEFSARIFNHQFSLLCGLAHMSMANFKYPLMARKSPHPSSVNYFLFDEN